LTTNLMYKYIAKTMTNNYHKCTSHTRINNYFLLDLPLESAFTLECFLRPSLNRSLFSLDFWLPAMSPWFPDSSGSRSDDPRGELLSLLIISTIRRRTSLSMTQKRIALQNACAGSPSAWRYTNKLSAWRTSAVTWS